MLTRMKKDVAENKRHIKSIIKSKKKVKSNVSASQCIPRFYFWQHTQLYVLIYRLVYQLFMLEYNILFIHNITFGPIRWDDASDRQLWTPFKKSSVVYSIKVFISCNFVACLSDLSHYNSARNEIIVPRSNYSYYYYI